MKRHVRGVFLGALLASAMGTAAWAHHASQLEVDTPAMVDGVNAVCTGIGTNAREDPRWQSFPLRIEISGKHGQYLGDAVVNVKGPGIDDELMVRCSGPWVLVDVPAGRYTVMTSAGHDGPTRTATVNVGETQKRLVMNFANLGGEVSPTQMFAVAPE
jgi:hypothetical protein